MLCFVSPRPKLFFANSFHFSSSLVCFSPKPGGYWDNEENIKNFLSELRLKLNLNTIDDWKFLTKKQIKANGGGTLFNKYSIFEIKCIGYPEGKNEFAKSNKTVQSNLKKPSNFWKNEDNIHNFLSELKAELLSNSVDLNSVSGKQIASFGGGTLLKKYTMEEIRNFFATEVLPNKTSLQNDIAYSGYWDSEENIKNFMEKLRNEFNLNSIEDWNLITSKNIISLGGRTLLDKYSMYEIKCFGCPDGIHTFSQPKKRISNPKPAGFWKNNDNVQNYLTELKEKLKLNSIDDWVQLTKKDIESNGGSTLLKKYTLKEIKIIGFPEGKSVFLEQKSIIQKPTGYWDNYNNIQNFIDKLKINFDIKSKEDWKRVSKTQIRSLGGLGLISKIENDSSLLERFPELRFISFNNGGRSAQRWLFIQIQKLFPGEEIVEDYFHSEISRITGFHVQFDVFLVRKKIAFEYHGIQHYEDIPASGFATIEMSKQRDNEKEKLAKQFGITLIIIPYWWDNNLDSLRNTIESKLK